MTTKTERVLAYLQNGHVLSEAQARARFDVRNMRAMATHLRYKGYAIYCNPKTLSDGTRTSVYKIGAPRRAVVAAGYRALAQAA